MAIWPLFIYNKEQAFLHIYTTGKGECKFPNDVDD